MNAACIRLPKARLYNEPLPGAAICLATDYRALLKRRLNDDALLCNYFQVSDSARVFAIV